MRSGNHPVQKVARRLLVSFWRLSFSCSSSFSSAMWFHARVLPKPQHPSQRHHCCLSLHCFHYCHHHCCWLHGWVCVVRHCCRCCSYCYRRSFCCCRCCYSSFRSHVLNDLAAVLVSVCGGDSWHCNYRRPFSTVPLALCCFLYRCRDSVAFPCCCPHRAPHHRHNRHHYCYRYYYCYYTKWQRCRQPLCGSAGVACLLSWF